MNADYDTYVKENILGILDEGKTDLNYLLKRCHSIFPDELKRLLTEMKADKLIFQKNEFFFRKKELSLSRNSIYKAFSQKHKEAKTGLLKLRRELHQPHCLDYEWWFSDNSLEIIFRTLLHNHLFELPTRIVFLGAPIFAVYISYFLPETKIIILDKSLPTLEYIKRNIGNSNIITVLYNAEDKLPKELIGIADMVFFDPPWYLEYYMLFIKRAMQLTFGHHSTIGMAFFPIFTRPAALVERKKIITDAMNSGLNLIKLETNVLSYETPFFEKKALEQSKISLKNWRKGDIAIFFNNGQNLPKNTKCRIEKDEWKDFLIGKMKVKVKKKNSELGYVEPCILSENPKEAVIHSVSRRLSIRKDIDLWTSSHVGLKIEGWQVISLILDGIVKKKNFDEIAKTIQESFEDISINKIKKDAIQTYQILKEILT